MLKPLMTALVLFCFTATTVEAASGSMRLTNSGSGSNMRRGPHTFERRKGVRVKSASGAFSRSNRERGEIQKTKAEEPVADQKATSSGSGGQRAMVSDDHVDLDYKATRESVKAGRSRTSSYSTMRMEEETTSFERNWNVHFHPLSLLANIYSVEVDRRIAPRWTAGLSLTKSNAAIEDSDGSLLIKDDSFGGGLRATWYSRAPFVSSFYVTPSITYRRGTMDMDLFTTESIEYQVVSIAAIGGYRWHFDSFNFGLALGVGSSHTSADLNDEDFPSEYKPLYVSSTYISGELSVGFSF